jgi:hypothetical protein
MKSFAGVAHNYPMGKNFLGHLFLDTMNIQNLIWSIWYEVIVARLLRFGDGHN